MRMDAKRFWMAAAACLVSAPALAYVGPGAGLTLLSALWGLLVAVLAAVGFLILWPLRRWRRRRQAAMESGVEMAEDDTAQSSADSGKRRTQQDGDA